LSIQKFIFPSRGFPFVENKVAEADYFLSLLEEKQGSSEEFKFYSQCIFICHKEYYFYSSSGYVSLP
jgi:hypothetical protein